MHVGGAAAEVLRTTDGPAGGLPERPFMLLGQQSIADPSRAPAGKHTAWAYTHGPHSVDWAAERERHVERMEAQVERFAPGFRERILARHVLGPADLEARNANLARAETSAAAATRSIRSSSVPCRRWLPTARPCGASTWAAPRPSRAELCTGCRATPPPASRSPRRASVV